MPLECAVSRSLARPRKRWIDIRMECLRKRGLDERQARRRVQDRSEWRGFVRGNAWCIARGMNTVVGCRSYMKPLKCGIRLFPSQQLKGYKGKISVFLPS